MDFSSAIMDSQAAAIKDFMFLLSSFDGAEVTIDAVLENLGKHYGADRVCTFEMRDGCTYAVGTYEWCREGTLSVKENPRNAEHGIFKSWDERFKSEIGLFIEVDEKMQAENSKCYEILSSNGVDCLIAAPLLFKGEVFGVLAIENPRINKDHLLLASVVSNSIFRGIQFSRVQKQEAHLKMQLEEDIAAIGGLASEYECMLVVDLDSGEFETFSEGKKMPKEAMDMGHGNLPFYEGFTYAMKVLCHPDDFERMVRFADRKYLTECLKNKKRFSTRFRCLDLEKNYIWVDAVIIKFDPIDKDPTRISLGYVNTDAEVAAENERQRVLKDALEKAEAANKAKTIFLGNMSHDIRTPLNAILGFARLMENELDDPRILVDYLKKIRMSGEYLLSILNNVLDLACIESGNMRLDEGFMDVLDASNSFDAIIEGELLRKNIKLIPSSNISHQYICADSAKLKQIMVNIVGNAVKFTGEGGEIHLDLSEKPCDREGYGTYVTTVSDNGIGMSKEFQSKIYESFVRERNTTDSGIAGAGLGMSIVKKLVDLMGGKIEMESELGKGTTFRITNVHKLMEVPENYGSKENQSEERVDFKGKRVLLAEDNELNAEIAIAILEDLGLLVEHVEDGVACVDAMSKAPVGYYNMILMDIQMPNMDGYKATRAIRNMDNRLKANIAIYAMTANAFEEDKSKARESGMDGHLSKPIDMGLLVKGLTEGFRKPVCYV